jgi:hypothetical protein
MNLFRCVLAGSALLLGGLTPARGQGKILVSGDPPLTQEVVDLYQEMWEWYCDTSLTPAQRSQYRRLFINWWSKRDRASKQQSMALYRDLEKQWRAHLELKGADQERRRAQTRRRWMAVLRKAADDLSQFLVRAYDAAYSPGGPQNPVLVARTSPLTRALLELDTAFAELILAFRLTDAERAEYRQLVIKDWQKGEASQVRHWARNLEALAELPAWGSYKRNEIRALNGPKFLAGWAKGSTESTRWLWALHKAASRPGSARNPVLVAADPPLTQQLADRYRDYVEIMLDLSASGGFSPAQRQVLQDYLVKGWKTMKADDRSELLIDLQRWADAAGQGIGEASKCIAALRPKLLAQLRTTPDDPRSQWLLEVCSQERQFHERNLALERLRHEGVRQGLDAMPFYRGGHWEFNPKTRKYDRWVPNR